MKKAITSILLLLVFIISSCSSTQSLQEYYIDNTENPNFLAFDVPTSILNLESADLTSEQKKAFESLKKLNILAFKKTLENVAAYKTEKANVRAILSNDDYTQLMKMNTEFGKAVIQYKGEENAIDEVIIFGDNEEKGFALIRVLGNEMNPAHFVQFLQALQKSDFNGEGLGDLGEFFKG